MANSINTNVGAQVALQFLNNTNRALDTVQKRVSTGLKVADATDDGAAFAIAQGLRSDVAGLTAVNSQLGSAKGLLSVANAAATSVSDSLAELRDVATRLADEGVTGNERTQYAAQFDEIEANIKAFIDNASYNGTNLLNSGATDVAVISTVSGGTVTIGAQDIETSVYDNLDNSALTTAADYQGFLTGAFASAETNIGTALNALGADTRSLDSRIQFNTSQIDAIEQGLGALVDADLAKESARLQALQTQQQLAVQSLSIANQSPVILLSLFR